MRRAMMATMVLGLAFSGLGCWRGHYEQRMAAFEQRVADRCVAAAARGVEKAPEVVVVPGGARVVTPPAQPGAAPAATVIIVPQ